MNLENKVAFITGAANGIGKAIAVKLSEYGVNICAADIDLDKAKETISEIEKNGVKGIALKLNVTDQNSIKEAVKKTINKFEKIDYLVNSAGIIKRDLVVDLDEKAWDSVMAVNAKGPFLVSKEIAKEMIKQKDGKIINVSSQAAKTGEKMNAAYCCSKASVSMLTQVLALELAEHNIQVNAICPGVTDTDMAPDESEKELREQLISGIPLNRMAKPEEIAELTSFLLSEKSNYITGTSVVIAGGNELH